MSWRRIHFDLSDNICGGPAKVVECLGVNKTDCFSSQRRKQFELKMQHLLIRQDKCHVLNHIPKGFGSMKSLSFWGLVLYSFTVASSSLKMIIDLIFKISHNMMLLPSVITARTLHLSQEDTDRLSSPVEWPSWALERPVTLSSLHTSAGSIR